LKHKLTDVGVFTFVAFQGDIEEAKANSGDEDEDGDEGNENPLWLR